MTLPIHILILCMIQLLTALAAYQYMVHRTDEALNLKGLLQPKLDWNYVAVASVSFAASVLILIKGLLCDEKTFIQAFVNAEIMIGLATMGYIDLREKIIPNVLIIAGLGFWVVYLLIDIFIAKTPWLDSLAFSLIGAFAVGGLLFLISLIAKNALGMGDVKMFFLLGLFYGLANTYAILLFSIIIMALVSLVLLAIKKATVKTAIPMAPFVVLGFILCIMAGM